MARKRKNPHAVALGRRGGRVTSPAKLAANRRNAQLAGRPPKFAPGDRVRANQHAPLASRGRIGTVVKPGPRKSQFIVRFGTTNTALMSWWLDAVE